MCIAFAESHGCRRSKGQEECIGLQLCLSRQRTPSLETVNAVRPRGHRQCHKSRFTSSYSWPWLTCGPCGWSLAAPPSSTCSPRPDPRPRRCDASTPAWPKGETNHPRLVSQSRAGGKGCGTPSTLSQSARPRQAHCTRRCGRIRAGLVAYLELHQEECHLRLWLVGRRRDALDARPWRRASLFEVIDQEARVGLLVG
eukprot:scaffold7474_cov113-Isochrysis_galbana.AAC.7